jgi:hypothetical protein
MDLPNPFFTIVIGKPASGKSHLMNYILMCNHENYTTDPFKYGIVFTTTKFNKSWSNIVPEQFVHPKYNETALDSLMKLQAEHNNNRAFVIFDDCLDQKAFASQLFLNLVTTYRHYNISVMISTQYLYRVTTTVRECASRVAIFRLTTERSLKAAFESFGAYFSNFNEFRKYIIDNTGNFQFIYYEANSSKENKKDIYKIMKAPDNLPKVKFNY